MASLKKPAAQRKGTTRPARRRAARKDLPPAANAPLGGALVVVVDTAGRIVRWNAAFEAAIGAGHDLTGRSAQDIIMPGGRSPRLAGILGRIAGKDGSVSFESSLPSRNGAKRTILWTASDCRDAADRVKQVVCAGVDITDEERLRGLADQRQQELLHMYRLHSAGGLAAALAHEVGQPLAALVSYCEAARQILQSGRPNRERVAQHLDSAVREAHRAANIIRELRDFIRKDRAEPEKFGLESVIEAAVRLVRPAAHAQGVRIDLQLKKRLPPLKGRSVQIEQLLVNLLTNAIDSIAGAGSTDGQIMIIAKRDATAGMARVSVSDSGPGLSDEVARRMFNPFYTTKGGGLGIGLMIARSIAEAHGGQLWAEKGPGGGTIFHFTAPFWR